MMVLYCFAGRPSLPLFDFQRESALSGRVAVSREKTSSMQQFAVMWAFYAHQLKLSSPAQRSEDLHFNDLFAIADCCLSDTKRSEGFDFTNEMPAIGLTAFLECAQAELFQFLPFWRADKFMGITRLKFQLRPKRNSP